MDQVKQMVAAGVSISTAIKEALGVSVSAWADRHGLSRPTTSEILNLVRSPDAATCAALAEDLGGEPYEWAMTLWQSAQPTPERFAA